MLVSNKGSGRGSEFSRQRAPIGITTRKCSECTTSGTLSELRPPVEIAAAAVLCPFKLECIWYAFEPRIYRGFKRPRPRGFKSDSVQPSIRCQGRKRRAATTAANGRDGWLPALGTRGFQRPLSDPSTDLQVRCHGSEA